MSLNDIKISELVDESSSNNGFTECRSIKHLTSSTDDQVMLAMHNGPSNSQIYGRKLETHLFLTCPYSCGEFY